MPENSPPRSERCIVDCDSNDRAERRAHEAAGFSARAGTRTIKELIEGEGDSSFLGRWARIATQMGCAGRTAQGHFTASE
jgi:hypothetical protein